MYTNMHGVRPDGHNIKSYQRDFMCRVEMSSASSTGYTILNSLFVCFWKFNLYFPNEFPNRAMSYKIARTFVGIYILTYPALPHEGLAYSLFHK